MTVERVDGEVVFHCDRCPEFVETATRDFHVGVEAAKRAGWRFDRDGEQWNHICPSCVEDDENPPDEDHEVEW